MPGVGVADSTLILRSLGPLAGRAGEGFGQGFLSRSSECVRRPALCAGFKVIGHDGGSLPLRDGPRRTNPFALASMEEHRHRACASAGSRLALGCNIIPVCCVPRRGASRPVIVRRHLCEGRCCKQQWTEQHEGAHRSSRVRVYLHRSAGSPCRCRLPKTRLGLKCRARRLPNGEAELFRLRASNTSPRAAACLIRNC
jgi:hypothetical protein